MGKAASIETVKERLEDESVSVSPAGAQVKQQESLRKKMRVMHSLRLQSEMGPETSPNDLGKLL